ncbi:MAG: hypothetical protein ACRBCL_11565 [Maritimibacter sp.]
MKRTAIPRRPLALPLTIVALVATALPANAQGPLPSGYVPNSLFAWTGPPSQTSRQQGRARILRGESQERSLQKQPNEIESTPTQDNDLEFGGEINFGMAFTLPAKP